MIPGGDVWKIIELSQLRNNLFVLKLADKENYLLEQEGSVLNLDPRERVQSDCSWEIGGMSSLSGK